MTPANVYYDLKINIFMNRQFGLQNPNITVSKLVNLLFIREDPNSNLIVVFSSHPDKIPDSYPKKSPTVNFFTHCLYTMWRNVITLPYILSL